MIVSKAHKSQKLSVDVQSQSSQGSQNDGPLSPRPVVVPVGPASLLEVGGLFDDKVDDVGQEKDVEYLHDPSLVVQVCDQGDRVHTPVRDDPSSGHKLGYYCGDSKQVDIGIVPEECKVSTFYG